MKILFLILPTVSKEYDAGRRYMSCVLPYGVLSIATYIRANSLHTEVFILDLCVEKNSAIVNNPKLLQAYLKEKEIDIVGISVMFSGGLSYLNDFANAILAVHIHFCRWSYCIRTIFENIE